MYVVIDCDKKLACSFSTWINEMFEQCAVYQPEDSTKFATRFDTLAEANQMISICKLNQEKLKAYEETEAEKLIKDAIHDTVTSLPKVNK